MKGVDNPVIDRRRFLKTVAAAGGAAAIASVTGNAAAEDIKHPAHPEPAARGYQKTSHVKAYYETARL